MALEIRFVSPKVWPGEGGDEVELRQADEQPVQAADDDEEQEEWD